jgi:hypothetical protein
MATNILHAIQKNLGYPVLQKIDANTQEVAHKDTAGEDRFGQAAIPAVLIALYEYTRSDEGSERILHGDVAGSWITLIFNGYVNEAVKKVSVYAEQSFDDSLQKMNAIADEAVRLIKERVGAGGTLTEVKNLLAHQRNDVLPYLPASMQIGSLLNDSTLDDRTNKMQGPISSLMHAIGNGLSGSGVKEDTTSL